MSVRVALVVASSIWSACAGCTSLPIGLHFQSTSAAVDPPPKPALLAVDAWRPNDDWDAVIASGSSQSVRDARQYRWRFAQHEESRSSDGIPDERTLAELSRRDDLVGWNALILWAQHAPSAATSAVDKLHRLAANPPSYHPTGDVSEGENGEPDAASSQDLVRISTNMQAAAAEIWCHVLAAQAADSRAALAPAGRLLAAPSSKLPTEVRAELIRSLGRWIPRGHEIPGVEESLLISDSGRRSDVVLRRAAVDACLMQALSSGTGWDVPTKPMSEAPEAAGFDEADWPPSLGNCEFDPDAHVRRAFGQWLAAVKHPRALEILKQQIDHSDPHVRDSALASLGLLGTDAARDELREQVRHGKPWIRHMAVRALARWGVEELTPWTGDPESLVRISVAEELGVFPGVSAGVALQRLVTDRNPHVQWAAAQAVTDWPPHLAAPVCFYGFRDGSPRTRHICLAQLQSTAGGELTTLATKPRTERIVAATRIARESNLPMAFTARSSHERSKASGHPPANVRDKDRTEGELLWRRLTTVPEGSAEYWAALDALSSLPSADKRRLEERLLTSSVELSPALQRDLATRLSPAYAALQELDSTNVEIRRRAARKLAAYGAESSLAPTIVRELAQRLTDEQDRAVWQSAMDAVRLDATEESAQLALLAVNHVWPDIRIMGCQYIGRHGRPEHASWLLPLFDDANRNVQVEAVTAAGRCRNPLVLSPPSDPSDAASVTGLRGLLSHSDPRLRFAAIVAASRLGDRTGMQELVALSQNDDAAVREDAIRAMGESGQTRFVDDILRLAWTERSDAVKRTMLESLDQLIPTDEQPAGLADGGSYDDKIILWVRWWDGRRGP